jgi:acyl-coenzyme A thioesterase PaaI-like protein
VIQAIQDAYADQVSHCYGCGRLNREGLHIKTNWEGEETVTRFRPRPEHMAIPGFVYGGLIASLIDCHSTATAAAAMYRAEGREMDTKPAFRFVTASLHVDFVQPTPMDVDLELRGRVTERGEKRVIVAVTVSANGAVTARGQVVAVLMPKTFDPGCT